MGQIRYMWINEIGPKIYFSDKIEKDMEVGKKKCTTFLAVRKMAVLRCLGDSLGAFKSHFGAIMLDKRMPFWGRTLGRASYVYTNLRVLCVLKLKLLLFRQKRYLCSKIETTFH